jgi:transposase
MVLAYIVQNEMQLQPFAKAVFIVYGRSRPTINTIVWDRDGWVGINKRLECKSSFRWPMSDEAATLIRSDQLIGLLDGHDMWRILHRAAGCRVLCTFRSLC